MMTTRAARAAAASGPPRTGRRATAPGFFRGIALLGRKVGPLQERYRAKGGGDNTPAVNHGLFPIELAAENSGLASPELAGEEFGAHVDHRGAAVRTGVRRLG